MSAAHAISLENVSKHYGAVKAIDDVSLAVAPGEFITLLGPSGSGKTTVLMAIAGFVAPSRGVIRVDGVPITERPPEQRNFGVVFQGYALFPHMTVAENVAYPLRVRRRPKTETSTRVKAALDLVQLGPLADRLPPQLSGGQQQRVALARALVFEPPVLLMDEPLGALDRKLREQLQGEIKRIQQTLGLTVVYVTHDQEEALVLSDRIAVMAGGEIRQMGPPAELYERPASRFVAQFLGESNFLAGRIVGQSGERFRVELRGGGIVEAPRVPGCAAELELLVRPESFTLSHERLNGANALPGKVETVEVLGASIRYAVATAAGTLSVRTPRSGAQIWAAGDVVLVSWRVEEGQVVG
ncbi:MAG TPA: ABC transporter ATP-binding protein [Stellaceae bacterium]|nr:ABC transporter ATP-binding protein [Stellaceae bacterium]